ncbi:MAG: cob(I)yrinic acid a,c-diamide adenosyltransferase [Acidobacteria bacterium]|nr:cob(I)yrinic acid a,c-diamide adenosyltransferase [Acidobacteriota bacterium]
MRITKVYTRSGDEGTTSLAGGERVSKASQRVCAYGDVDELNSFLGLARSRIADAELQQLLQRIQNDLFVIGADLATPAPDAESNQPDRVRRTSAAEVEQLENAIDHYNETLPPLEEFILPAGNEAAGLLHVARAVARRAERQVAGLACEAKLNPQVIVYLNRLSDLLFVLARVVNRREGAGEIFARFF